MGLRTALVCSAVLTAALPTASPAQIASPGNAAQNSGNNGPASSFTSLSTPNFSIGVYPLVADVTVQPDGSLTAPPDVVDAVQRAIQSVLSSPQGSVISPLVYPDSPLSRLPDDSLVASNANVKEPRDQAALNSRTTLGSVDPSGLSPIKTSAKSTDLVMNDLTAQLVRTGLTLPRSEAIIEEMFNLGRLSNLRQLDRAIRTYNQILSSADQETRLKLQSSPVFSAIGLVLRSVRGGAFQPL